MGVKGLWKILEPAGRPVKSAECLRDQKVAIDASIWLYQFIRVLPPGSPNSIVLSGLFKRICKLIYFDIKPILVFDGAAPLLKRKTTAMRSVRRGMAEDRFRRVARRLLVRQMQLQKLCPQDANIILKEEETFDNSTPSTVKEVSSTESEEEDYFELDEEVINVEINKPDFQNLPADLKQYLLMAKKERMLQQTLNISKEEGSKMPAIDFSHLQINALVKRRKIAEELEKVKTGSLFDFESEYLGKGKERRISGRRIASESNRHYVLVKNRKQEGGWSFGIEEKDGNNEEPPTCDPVGKLPSLEVDEEFDNLFGVAEERNEETKEATNLVKHNLSTLQINNTGNGSVHKEIDLSVNSSEYAKEVDLGEEELSSNASFLPIKIIDVPSEAPSKEVPTVYPADDLKRPSEDTITELVVDHVNKESEDEEEYEVEEERYIYETTTEVLNSKISDQDRNLLIEKLQNEVDILKAESKSIAPLSTSIDNELLEEFKRMLTIMGIPWIVAPGEAEAQCAWLQCNGHVDTVITDDNDVFLFGASSAHRHFFNQNKRISHYLIRDINRELRLDRSKLIIMSLLLGSDYSAGIRGIGPIMATKLFQILSDHCHTPEEWLSTISTGLSQDSWPSDCSPVDRQFLTRLYEKCPVDESFKLDDTVYRAFMEPNVDEREVSFRWNGMFNDLNAIRKYLISQLKWSEDECQRSLDSLILRKR